MASSLNKCFIVAPVGVNTAVLRAALEGRGIGWTDAASAPSFASISESIYEAIAQADFVCGVLANDANPNVMFELGLAVGRHIPALVFAEPGAQIPFDARQLSFVRASLDDREALDFCLDAFLGNFKPNPVASSGRSPKQANPVDTRWAEEFLVFLRQRSEKLRALELERVVARLFEQAGGLVSIAPADMRGADMALWLDGVEGIFGNPLLIEVKSGALSPVRLDEAERQLRKFLISTQTQAGILVYWDTSERSYPQSLIEWPLVLRFELLELINLVRRGELLSEFFNRRNLAVHRQPG